CRDNKWLINNKFYLTGTVECKNCPVHANEGNWFVHKDGEDLELEIAECTRKMKCEISTNYNNTCPCTAPRCCGRLEKNDGLRCPVEHTLRVIQLSGVLLSMDK
ncbi:hypothetical protein PFISCL1PPCAC_26051, partial [Pristionchus fissidentatus]